MAIRLPLLTCLIAALSASLAGCRPQPSGPLVVSAIGSAPGIRNPNLQPLDAPSSILLQATGQGLVRFDAGGQIEPALAQSWIVSDDGLRYTFRIARTEWQSGGQVTAEQVAARLRAAASRSSRNSLKPLLGAIAEIEAMTDVVLEIVLKAPRPNFLQLLAQPDMAVLRGGRGTGPYHATNAEGGALLLRLPADEEETEGTADAAPDILLRGEGPALAVARFESGLADFVTGGTAGNLPIARAANLTNAALRFDPAAGLFGIVFGRGDDILANVELRRALSMAIDRDAIVAAIAAPDLQSRLSVVPVGMEELPAPALPLWAADPLPLRQERARAALGTIGIEAPLRLRVAVPDGPGYRLVFAHLRRDWRAIGIIADPVGPNEDADLRLIDSVAAAHLPTWYLRHFTCAASAVCSREIDATLEAARNTLFAAERQRLLAEADRAMAELVPFIPISAPVRWSLVSPRLTGFQPNPFAQRFVGSLLVAAP